jgi:hypothetical protein
LPYPVIACQRKQPVAREHGVPLAQTTSRQFVEKPATTTFLGRKNELDFVELLFAAPFMALINP